MIVAMLTGASLMAASPAPAAAAGAAPLREVVYRVSYTRHERINTESFGGNENPMPAVQGAEDSDEGTITVDVMAVAQDTLGVRLIESWKQRPRPATYTGNIGPDGSTHFGGQPIGEAALDMLPIFGPKWMNGQAVDVGVSWKAQQADQAATVTTNYQIVSVSGDGEVTISESQVLTVRSVQGMNGSTTATIVYKPSLLVPVSGRFERRSGSGDASTSDIETMVINITRLSDSLDPAK